MKYKVVDSSEWMYPDVTDYATAASAASLTSLRGGFASFQIMLTDAPSEGVVVDVDYSTEASSARGVEICLYRLKSVRVEGNPGFDGKPLTAGTVGFNSPDMNFSADEATDSPDMNAGAGEISDEYSRRGYIPSQPCRRAPYRVYDCICPLGDAHRSVYSPRGDYRPFTPTRTGAAESKHPSHAYMGVAGGDCTSVAYTGAAEKCGVIALYVTLRFESAGVHRLTLRAGDVNIPVTVTVLDAPVPDEKLQIAVGYYPWATAKYHGVEFGSPEFSRINEMYLRLMRRSRQNVLYVDHPDCRHTDEGWKFDFSHMERAVRRGLELGFTYFFIYGLGFRKSWSEETILIRGMDSESEEGIAYTRVYLTALRDFLRSRGWLDRFAMGVADEPNSIDIDRYTSLARRMKEIFPELALYDAVSYLPELRGTLDICIPRADEYNIHRDEFHSIARAGAQLWHYVCLFPRGGGYINRFMDMPLLASRYLMWGCFANNLTGFLHWSVNCWMDGQDPFECNCPDHVNAGSGSILPPGDSHSVYPGEGEPWMSMRLEAQRMGAEEYEMLRIIAGQDENTARALCGECFHDFAHVEYDPAKLRRTREAIMKAYNGIWAANRVDESNEKI